MTEFVLRVIEAEDGETVDIPDSARDIEMDYYDEVEVDDDGEPERVTRCRLKYLERVGESVQ